MSDFRGAPGESAYIDAARARLGRVVAGRWTLKKLLGVGGNASVYEAHHRNGSRAALKILHPEVVSRPSARRRFLSEGYAANKVQHPGVVLILDDGEDGELLFLVMELLSGRSLAERLADEGPLPAAEVVRICAAVLAALGAAHDRGVVHRDIKPSNIFELESGEIKVLDFGLARVREGGSPTVTESGVTLGTPAFMAPEQARGMLEQIDALTDIWAVGATLFQLLTGRLVHEARTPNAAIVAAATQRVAPIRSFYPELPRKLAGVVDRALAFEPECRWPNALAMRSALVESAPETGEVPAYSRPSSPITVEEVRHDLRRKMPSTTRSRRRAVWAFGSLAVVACVGAAGLWFRSENEVAPAPAASTAKTLELVRPAPTANVEASQKRSTLDVVENATPSPAASAIAPPPRRKKSPAAARLSPRSPLGDDERLIDTRL
jgi:serine/threonine-protein kinase